MSTEPATFETLLDLPPPERARRLGKIREEATETATRLERLLGLIAEDLAELDAAASDPRLGTTVGGWTLERRIGEGSSSIVYLGRAETGPPVAIKILRLDRLGESTRRRFEREIAAHSRLDHPGFARLLASDLAATPPWLAAEWVEDGRPITEWASLHAPSIDQRVALITQLREALSAAREAGVVHRDLSPNNVLVDRHGRVKIVDLGIARLLEDDEGFSRLSRTGRHAIGTPAYMAPEQIDPSFGPIGPWTDEYAAGLIAYRLLTGKLPYDTSGSFASVAQAIVHVPVAPLDLAACPAPLAVDTWIRSTLVKDVHIRRRQMSMPREQGELPRRGNVDDPCHRVQRSRRGSLVIGLIITAAIAATTLLMKGRRVDGIHEQRGDELPQKGYDMKLTEVRIMPGLAAAVAACPIAYSGVDAIEWRAVDGGNGHWYAVFSVERSRPAMIQLGQDVGGYPVAVTSIEEQQFLSQTFPQGWVLGLHAPAGSNVFSWMNGEPAVFTHWGTSACWSGPYPNNSFHPLERFVATSADPNCGYRWDDYPSDQLPDPIVVLVEWSADCNADGIVDFGQIRSGELPDINSNNIPDCCEDPNGCLCPSDLDDSGVVNSVDLAIILAAWGTNGGKYPQADIDGSGTVDATDLSEVLAGWGPCPD